MGLHWARVDIRIIFGGERQAGTTPLVDIQPRVAFTPTRLLKAAGTRPDPAVSVPRLKLT
jgi:hypothetical protein